MKSCCQFHADTLPHGCEQGRACPSRLNQDECGITFYGPEPEEDEALGTMLMAALAGVAALLAMVGGLAFLVYTLWPIVAASFN